MFIPKSINKIELKENLLVIEDKELNYGTLTEDDKEVLNTMISKGSKYLPLLYLNSRYMLESVNGKRLNKIEYLTYLLECKRIKKAGVKESNTKVKPLANIENLEILEGDNSIYFGKEGKLYEEFIGYDYWGSKVMEPFEGKAFIEYYGGPGNLQYLRKARNGRWIWVDSSNPGEPYLFNSFEEALKVQEELGGEIKSYSRDWLGESFNAEEYRKYRINNDDDLIVIRKNGEVIAKGMVDNLKDNWDRFDGFIFDEKQKKYVWEYNGDTFTVEKIIVENVKEGYEQGYMGKDFADLEDMYLKEEITAEELAEELLAMYDTREGAEEAFEMITEYPMSSLNKEAVSESVENDNIEEVSPEDMMDFLDNWECGDVEKTFGRKLICKDGDKFVALDNGTGDAWVEEFDLNDRGYAEAWLNGKMEYDDYRLLKKRVNEEAGTQVGDIAPKEDYIEPVVKVNTKKKKKLVKEDIEDAALKEPNNLKTPEEVLNYLKGREIIDWDYDGAPSSSGPVDYTISYNSYYLGNTDRSINAEDSSLQGLIDATFKSARNVGADISSSAADAGDFYGFETEEDMEDCISDEEAFLFNLGRDMERLTGLKNSLNESAIDDPTEEEIQLLKDIVEDLKNEPLVKKYLLDHTWLSGSSTTVYPITVSGPGKDVIVQLSTDKNVFNNLLKKYMEKYPVQAHFWKSDGSCPSTLNFKLNSWYPDFKNSLNETIKVKPGKSKIKAGFDPKDVLKDFDPGFVPDVFTEEEKKKTLNILNAIKNKKRGFEGDIEEVVNFGGYYFCKPDNDKYVSYIKSVINRLEKEAGEDYLLTANDILPSVIKWVKELDTVSLGE